MELEKTTPLLKQYFAIKEQHPDAVLLFQVGDFYELFFEDAKKISSFLAIALTRRGQHKGESVPLCGVPVHALQHYLVKLVKGGFKVALCEQMSKPQPGKVVERSVTQVFTPGTLTDAVMLDDKSASYLLVFYPGKKEWGLLFTELLTAQMFATTIPLDAYRMVESELIRFYPDEIVIPAAGGIIPQSKQAKKFDTYFRRQGYMVSEAAWSNDVNSAKRWLEQQFNPAILKQLAESDAITYVLHLLFWYLKKNQERALKQLRSIQFYQPEDYLILDASTQKNLEIIKNVNDGSSKNTLFSVVDKAVTSMGSRTIKKWLQRPLVQKQTILQRQEVVDALKKDFEAMRKFEELFSEIADLERIVGRVALQRALLADYLALKYSLQLVPKIKMVVQQHLLFYLTDVVQAKLRDFSALTKLLECALNDDGSKKIIKQGFDQELDRLRNLVENSQKEVLQLEQREIARTNISSLKVRFNSITGYYIEVTKANIKLVPDDYIQQQTLVNRNRYVTQELKDLERDIVRAQNELDAVEQAAFDRVKIAVEEELGLLRQLAQAIAYLDGLLGFARASYENNYVVPVFTDTRDIIIKKGRHPVVESAIGKNFIPNDTTLTDEESLWILTGPNMGGKSTYLRQVALLSILAQCGCLIPAESAHLPILDRIFTRIGSGDNLAEGKSTFLIEMEEAALICTQATKYSLVILDEVGRGTSTDDGIALAQAIVEYLVQVVQARCLFATHYHELTNLKEYFEKAGCSSIENYHMVCKKAGEEILFLHSVAKGVAKGSFGIEVAKLACLPNSIIERAKTILQGVVDQRGNCIVHNSDQNKLPQLAASFDEKDEVVKKLERELEEKEAKLRFLNEISLEDLSPREAFDILWKYKQGQK